MSSLPSFVSIKVIAEIWSTAKSNGSRNKSSQMIRQVVNKPTVYPDDLNHFIWRSNWKWMHMKCCIIIYYSVRRKTVCKQLHLQWVHKVCKLWWRFTVWVIIILFTTPSKYVWFTWRFVFSLPDWLPAQQSEDLQGSRISATNWNVIFTDRNDGHNYKIRPKLFFIAFIQCEHSI